METVGGPQLYCGIPAETYNMIRKAILRTILPTVLLMWACAKSQEVPSPTQQMPAPFPEAQPSGRELARTATGTEPGTEIPEAVRIQFQQGATAATLEDSLESGEKKRYVLYAFAGQTMRVFVEPLGLHLRIWGENGTVLRTEDDHLTFWRGELLVTQEYLIQVALPWKDPVEGKWGFRLSVLINPRGEAIQWRTYRDEEHGLELKYSDYFVESTPPPAVPLIKGNLVLSLTFVGSEYFENTNLRDVYFMVGTSADTDIVADCVARKGRYERVLGEEIVNSITFHKGAFTEGATGSFYRSEIYRTLHRDTCYEVAFLIHYHNIGGYDPESGIKRFDREAVLQKLREVFLTFRFVE